MTFLKIYNFTSLSLLVFELWPFEIRGSGKGAPTLGDHSGGAFGQKYFFSPFLGVSPQTPHVHQFSSKSER